MQKKVFDAQVKAMGEYEFMACASDESVDRDGDVIMVQGWDTTAYELNKVILFGHDYGKPPVARAKRVYKDLVAKKLMVDVEFPPAGTYEFADMIRKLVKGGYLNTLSVGFSGKKWEPMDQGHGRKYTACELLEISLVPVPANSNAMIIARSKGLISDREAKMLQGSFDPLVEKIASNITDVIMRKIKSGEIVIDDNEIDISSIPYIPKYKREFDLASIHYDPYEGLPDDVKENLQRCYIPNRETIAAINKWKDWRPPEDKRTAGGLVKPFGMPVKPNTQESERIKSQVGVQELKKARGW